MHFKGYIDKILFDLKYLYVNVSSIKKRYGRLKSVKLGSFQAGHNTLFLQKYHEISFINNGCKMTASRERKKNISVVELVEIFEIFH